MLPGVKWAPLLLGLPLKKTMNTDLSFDTSEHLGLNMHFRKLIEHAKKAEVRDWSSPFVFAQQPGNFGGEDVFLMFARRDAWKLPRFGQDSVR